MVVFTNCEGRVGLSAAKAALAGGGRALDAVEAGIRVVEADLSVVSVGKGGSPDLLGTMACDAAVMDGSTLQAGSVGAVRNCLHAVSLARKVMEKLPHVMLVADGAERFAREAGFEPTEMLAAAARERYRKFLADNVPPGELKRWPDVPLADAAWASTRDAGGTVVCLVRDDEGNIAAGTSTSGWAFRYPGRLGDSPIVGAGLYADTRHGACGCTHVGEMTIRAGTARSVVLYMKKGAAVDDACREALCDLRDLKGGFLGAVMVHAMDRDGRACCAATNPMTERFDAWQLAGMTEERVKPILLS
jgi:beta-aspartyl-peptidase (threonine type)